MYFKLPFLCESKERIKNTSNLTFAFPSPVRSLLNRYYILCFLKGCPGMLSRHRPPQHHQFQQPDEQRLKHLSTCLSNACSTSGQLCDHPAETRTTQGPIHSLACSTRFLQLFKCTNYNGMRIYFRIHVSSECSKLILSLKNVPK